MGLFSKKFSILKLIIGIVAVAVALFLTFKGIINQNI